MNLQNVIATSLVLILLIMIVSPNNNDSVIESGRVSEQGVSESEKLISTAEVTTQTQSNEKINLDENESKLNSSNSGSSGVGNNGGKWDSIVVSDNVGLNNIDYDLTNIDFMTSDQKSGKPCNLFINDLVDKGAGSVFITPQNDMFDVFCSQTIGASRWEDYDFISGDGILEFGPAFLEANRVGANIYASIVPYKNDKYITCSLRQYPDQWTELFCNLTIIDMREYFESSVDQKTEKILDIMIDDYTYLNYCDDFAQVGLWYSDNAPADNEIEYFINNLPTESDLTLQAVDYESLNRALVALQQNVRDNYINNS